jgi:CheY-like chemotaxis protein
VNHRVLVVDDEEDIRAIARLALEKVAGWHVRTASSGKEAIEAVADDPPEAVLLDVQMPDLDGPSTVQLLREDRRIPRVHILLLTAKVQRADRQRFAALDIDGVIAKPFDPMTLHVQIAEELGWSV